MRLKTWALLFGLVLILVGILGFIPPLTPNNMLLGLFEVDTMHNIIHILTGLIALFVMNNESHARIFFLTVGFIYAILAIIGFATNGNLFIMHVNNADNFLHLAIALFTLWIGFFNKELKY